MAPFRERDYKWSVEFREKRKQQAAELGVPYSTLTFSLDKLKKIQLKLHQENFRRYFAHLKAGSIESHHRVGYCMMQELGRIARNNMRITAPMLMNCSAALKVPPEALVDGEYYFKKNGFAGYRILLEAYKKGISFEELTYYKKFSDSDDLRLKSLWYSSWYSIICSRFHKIQSSMFTKIMQLCRERLEMDIGELLRAPGCRRVEGGGIMAELVDMFNVFDEYDSAFLMGVAKAVYDAKYSVSLSFSRNMRELTSWYGEKRKERERIRAASVRKRNPGNTTTTEDESQRICGEVGGEGSGD